MRENFENAFIKAGKMLLIGYVVIVICLGVYLIGRGIYSVVSPKKEIEIVYECPKEPETIIYDAPTETAKQQNPCYIGPNVGYIHADLDSDWVCPRCEEYVGPRYGFTDGEIYLLAQLLCGDMTNDGDGEYDFVWEAETRGIIRRDQIATVLCVVMNRVRSDIYPDTVKEVVLQKNQFAVMPKNLDAWVNQTALDYVQEWCDAYDRWDPGVQHIPENHLYFSSSKSGTNISRENWR